MKINLLGTGAYERIPAMFCECEVCRLALSKKGKNVRTQTSALIDDNLLIDFGQDNYAHFLQSGKRFTSIKGVLITHTHTDHYFPHDLVMVGDAYGHNQMQPVTVMGNAEAKRIFENDKEIAGCNFIELTPYLPYEFDKYTITPLPAVHQTENPYCYIISDGEKTIFYSLDTSLMSNEVYEWLKNSRIKIDCVICDCTCGLLNWENCYGHMSLIDCVSHRDKLLQSKNISKETKFIITHFSHNALFNAEGKAVTHEELQEIASEKDMQVAYDGYEIEI